MGALAFFGFGGIATIPLWISTTALSSYIKDVLSPAAYYHSQCTSIEFIDKETVKVVLNQDRIIIGKISTLRVLDMGKWDKFRLKTNKTSTK